MALTEEQKTAVRMFLVRPKYFTQLDTQLESRMVALSATEETVIVATLAKLTELETRLQSGGASASLARGVSKLDEIEFFAPGQGLEAAYGYGRTLIKRLTAILGVQPADDYFGSAESIGCPIPLG